jgi:hypothetical protein
VGLRAGLDKKDGEKYFASAADGTPIVQSEVRHYNEGATAAPQSSTKSTLI